MRPDGPAENRCLLCQHCAPSTDSGHQQDIGSCRPDEVQRLSKAYEAWWASLPPFLVNEDRPVPSMNPFKERYWKQFGITPTEEDLAPMRADARIR